MAKKPLVIANWKMYLESPEEAKAFAQGLKRKVKKIAGVDVAVAAPFPFIAEVAKVLKGSGVKVGAQTVSAHTGAHTGDVSAAMLKAVGVHFVIVGHSERRAQGTTLGHTTGETNEVVHAQLVQAAQAGLSPLLCVGELERSADGAHFTYIEEQLTSALRGTQGLTGKLVVAYEPVWAIGKGKEFAMQAEALEETVIFVRKILADTIGRASALKVPILYGGSVEADNALQLVTAGGASGLLVGHASATLDSFVAILNALRGIPRKI